MPKKCGVKPDPKLSAKEVGDLAELIADSDSDTSVELLLLCYALTHETDYSMRWDMLVNISTRLGAYLPGFQRMQEEAMASHQAMLRRQIRERLRPKRAKREKRKPQPAPAEVKA